LAAVVLFVAFVLFKSRVSLLPRDPTLTEARRKIRAAKKRARKAGDDTEGRVRAWLDAARIARDELDRPRLAASFALRAARVDPDHVTAITMMADTFKEAQRYRAAEKFLWRRLDGPYGPGYDAAFDELVELYEGPMRKRERAQALKAMRARSSWRPSEGEA
jgi:hypothetical protein